MNHSRYRQVEAAAEYIGCTSRWLRRHWPDMAVGGVRIYRLPVDALKGRLIFEKTSLDSYMERCVINSGKST